MKKLTESAVAIKIQMDRNNHNKKTMVELPLNITQTQLNLKKYKFKRNVITKRKAERMKVMTTKVDKRETIAKTKMRVTSFQNLKMELMNHLRRQLLRISLDKELQIHLILKVQLLGQLVLLKRSKRKPLKLTSQVNLCSFLLMIINLDVHLRNSLKTRTSKVSFIT